MRKPIIKNKQIVRSCKKFDYVQVSLTNSSNHSEYKREYMQHNGSSMIVPILEFPDNSDKFIVLIRVYRIPLDDFSWECCAGTIEKLDDDKLEDPQLCAQRELNEETGYQSLQWTKLATFHTSPGITDEIMHAYIAENLIEGKQDLEEDENITVHVFPKSKVMKMINSGEIKDAKTITAIFLAIHKGFL